MIWCSHDGVQLSTGGQPANISGEVIDFIRNGNPYNFFAELVDEEYHLYVGTVTVNGVTYTNTELIYNFPTQSWRWRELYNNMTIFARWRDPSTGRRLYMGDTTGTVWNKSKYTDSTIINGDAQVTTNADAQPIHSNFITQPLAFGEYSMVKALENLTAYSDRAGGLKLSARVLDKNSQALTKFLPVGQLKTYINSFQVDVQNGSLLQIQGAEYSKDPYWSFYGFDLQVEKYSDILKKRNK